VAANPGEEDRLVELASQMSLVELREECARVRAVADPDPEATNRRIHAARQLRQWVDGEGFWTLHAKGTPQAGAVFNTAIQPIIDQLFRGANRAGRREPVEAYAFDALIHLAEHATGTCTCTCTASEARADREDSAGDEPAEPTATGSTEHGHSGDDADSSTSPTRSAATNSTDEAGRGGLISAASEAPAGEPGIFAAGRGPRRVSVRCRPRGR
jgi:hypothetical protein